jgi:hypothetical protein
VSQGKEAKQKAGRERSEEILINKKSTRKKEKGGVFWGPRHILRGENCQDGTSSTSNPFSLQILEPRVCLASCLDALDAVDGKADSSLSPTLPHTYRICRGICIENSQRAEMKGEHAGTNMQIKTAVGYLCYT